MINARLHTLLEVYKQGSITKAAATLNLTQPAVSQHIRYLEDEYKVKLFLRGDRELKITEDGEILVKYAKRINALEQNLKIALKDRKKNIRHLNIGITQSLETGLSTTLLAEYCNENPKTHVTIISDTIQNLYQKLKTYEVDVILIDGKISDSNFNSILLDTDYLVLAVGNDNPLSKKSVVTLDELKKENLILRLPGAGTRTLFEANLSSNNQSIDDFNVILEVDNIAIIKELVKNNFGVSVLAHNTCLSELKKNKFSAIPVENLSITREINLIYHRDFEYPDILDEITRLYRKVGPSQ
ncbi:MAG: LysR family transcriptional regulator [Firmicutes bacterium]|jgi:transcriptional regulator, lysR family|nr:LysR family transcriptional regulator [Bacillota bacterium]